MAEIESHASRPAVFLNWKLRCRTQSRYVYFSSRRISEIRYTSTSHAAYLDRVDTLINGRSCSLLIGRAGGWDANRQLKRIPDLKRPCNLGDNVQRDAQVEQNVARAVYWEPLELVGSESAEPVEK